MGFAALNPSYQSTSAISIQVLRAAVLREAGRMIRYHARIVL
jgi:hypothetical protein